MNKCIKCGNFYLNEPDSVEKMCFRCEMEQKDKKIADLEAKLAESKEQVEIVEKQHSELLMTIFNGHKENFELKQQLAEKDNTITNLIEDSKASKELYKKQLNEQTRLCEEKQQTIDEINKKLKQQLAEKEKEIEEYSNSLETLSWENANLAFKSDQAKTEFAIQQLQKVKAFVNYAKIHKIDMINTHQLYEFMCQIIKEIEGETK